MIIVLLFVLFLVLVLSFAAGQAAKPTDNREPYLRDNAGHVWALVVGPDTTHEDYIHDGTPHQNPAVRSEWRWFLLFPYEVEVSYYPITINGRMLPDLDAIQTRVDEARKRGKDVQLCTLDAGLEREVIRRENGEQLGRDVSAGNLAYKLNGRKR